MTNERQTTRDGQTVGEYWQGRGSLAELVRELDRQKETKFDFVADCRSLSAVGFGLDSAFRERPTMILKPTTPQVAEFIHESGIELTDSAFGQLLERSDPPVPVRYGRKLLSRNPAAAGNLAQETFCSLESRRLFRCLDGAVRAILSDQYRIVDNYDLAFSALEVVKASGGEVIEASLNDRSMRLKFTTRSVWDAIETVRESGPKSSWYSGGLGSQEYLSKVAARSGGELPGGPGTVHPLVTLSNSETGHGGIRVRLGLLQGICYNVATVEDVVKEIHLGGKLAAGLYSEETQSVDSRAIFLKARDAIRAAFDPKRFSSMVAKIKKSAETPIEAPSAAVGIVAERLDLDDEKKASVLEHFLGEYAPTAFGLASAVTRVGQEIDDPERAEEFELFGGEIMTKPSLVLS